MTNITPTHLLLQDKTEPHQYQVTITHHNPMLLYTKLLSNPNKYIQIHACINTYAYSFYPFQESLGPGTHSPRSHKHINTTPIPTSPQYHPPCCSSPPHQIIAKKLTQQTVFNMHKLLHLSTQLIARFQFYCSYCFSNFTFIFMHL